MKQMEVYHKLAKDHFPEIRRHMFGGFQLLQRLSDSEAETRLAKMADEWKAMKTDKAGNNVDHRIHVEFADFSTLKFFKHFEKYAVRNANSLGMNEQELKMLLDYWALVEQNKDTSALGDRLLEVQDSRPSFKDII